jgi:hypothetical protein
VNLVQFVNSELQVANKKTAQSGGFFYEAAYLIIEINKPLKQVSQDYFYDYLIKRRLACSLGLCAILQKRPAWVVTL